METLLSQARLFNIKREALSILQDNENHNKQKFHIPGNWSGQVVQTLIFKYLLLFWKDRWIARE